MCERGAIPRGADAPALWPKIVTRVGSPPKAPMLACTQRIDSSWSSGGPAEGRLARACGGTRQRPGLPSADLIHEAVVALQPCAIVEEAEEAKAVVDRHDLERGGGTGLHC